MIRCLILAALLSGCTQAIKNCSAYPYPIQTTFLNGAVDVTGLQVKFNCDVWE